MIFSPYIFHFLYYMLYNIIYQAQNKYILYVFWWLIFITTPKRYPLWLYFLYYIYIYLNDFPIAHPPFSWSLSALFTRVHDLRSIDANAFRASLLSCSISSLIPVTSPKSFILSQSSCALISHISDLTAESYMLGSLLILPRFLLM